VAKAHAADGVAARIHAETGANALVSLGGDVAVAGSPPGGWDVLVTDDHRADHAVGQLVGISGGGLATSSTTVRRWRVAGRDVHHLVDPASGRPAAEYWRTVSVAAATCVDANAAATASIVMGASAPSWLERLGLAARLVRRDGSVTLVADWPPETP
jgi:thiamine biosynthesis lipoprotein